MIYIARWVAAIIFYLLIVLTLFAVRPAMMFDAEGNPKPFGAGFKEGASVFAPAIFFPMLGFLCYFVATWLHVVLTKRKL